MNEIDDLPEMADLPDFESAFEQKPRSLACLLALLLATPVLLACSLGLLALLVSVSLQLVTARP